MMPSDRPKHNQREMHRFNVVIGVVRKWIPKAQFTFSEGRIRVKTFQYSLNDAFLEDMSKTANARIAEVALPNRHPDWGLIVDFIVAEELV